MFSGRALLQNACALGLIAVGLFGMFGHPLVNLAGFSPWLSWWLWLLPVVVGIAILWSGSPAESDEWTQAARALGFRSIFSAYFPATPFQMPKHISGCFAMDVAGLSVWIGHRCRMNSAPSRGDLLFEFALEVWDWWLWNDSSCNRSYRHWNDYDRWSTPADRFPSADLSAVETFVLLSHPTLALPRFELRPEGLGDKFSALLGGDDINYPSHPKFSARYFLRGPDEAAVGAAFGDAALLDYLGEHPGWNVRADGAWLLVTQGNQVVPPEALGDFLRNAIELHGMFREADGRQQSGA
jgi:hypothetical protein